MSSSQKNKKWEITIAIASLVIVMVQFKIKHVATFLHFSSFRNLAEEDIAKLTHFKNSNIVNGNYKGLIHIILFILNISFT